MPLVSSGSPSRRRAEWTLIDTRIRTHHAARMATKEKRTYNLTPATVRAVRELADEYHAATTQDAVVELAVSELARHLRDAEEARAWATASTDTEFAGEVHDIQDAYRSADRETWPA